MKRYKRTLTTAQQETIQKEDQFRVSKITVAAKAEEIGLRIDEKIKLQRAQGGCPGTIRRRRTWQAAKSYGEPQAGTDP